MRAENAEVYYAVAMQNVWKMCVSTVLVTSGKRSYIES